MDNTQSYYFASSNQKLNQPKLTGKLKVDVCVIGGGISGLSTALHAKNLGLDVALVESQTLGYGASGRSGGQMIIGYNQSYNYLKKHYGAENANQLWHLGEEAMTLTRSLIQRYQIDCDLADGHYHVGTKPRHTEELKVFLEDLNQAGYQHCYYLNREELQSKINSPRYFGGVYDPKGGHLHPLNYTLGLAKAAIDSGVKVFENTRVVQIEKGHPIRIQTPEGQIEAQNLVICCNAYLNGLEPYLDKKIMPVKTYIVATESMTKKEARSILTDNAAVADVNFVLNYYRFSKDHRMLFGGRVNYSGLNELQLTEKMRKLMVHFFPSLEHKKIEYAWGGNVAITINRLPHIGRLTPNIYFAQGYSGHGIALTGLAGKVIANAIALKDQAKGQPIEVFEQIKHRSFPGGKLFRTPLLVLSMAYYRLRDLL